jgi:uncharacterized membrane protein
VNRETLAAEATADAAAEAEARATERVITFSDAVVAIAITLLALALTPPAGTSHWTDGQFLSALHANDSQYFAFLISFVVIGSHWASHRSVTRYMCRLNGTFNRLNMIWLLMMIMTPFATKLLSGQGGSSARYTIYAVIQIIATTCLMLMSRTVARGNLLRRDAPERARQPDIVPYLGLCLIFLLSIPVAFIVPGSPWPYVLWIASPLAVRGLRRIMARGRHTTSEDSRG